ncbi:MAG: putative DNA endonuclease SmrA [Syntrophorhabdus sp. PtaU1.Bin153]|nr:MAG: putative DNA endonuclease SmrA [Syntrophorhabdus sp. PtaU1.Bin153]
MHRIDSLYAVFSNLPDFVKNKGIPLKESCQDEQCAYAEAMEGVRTIPPGKSLVRRKTPAKTPQIAAEDDPKTLIENALRDKRQLNVVNMPEFMEGYADGTNPLTLEKLRGGKFSVQKTLDLHGYSIEEARALFEDFIRSAVRSGLNCIKVIHGRGLRSKETPVLKEKLKAWIIQAMHRKWITAFSSALMCDGGPGATYVLLKKTPGKKYMHIIG